MSIDTLLICCRSTIVGIATLVGLAIAPSPIRADQPDAADSALQIRVRELEARLAAFEDMLHAGASAKRDDPALETSNPPETATLLAALEQRMAALEQMLRSNMAPSSSAEPLNPAPAAQVAPAADSFETSPFLLTDKALFLPSRGHAGGLLHYGEAQHELQFHAFLDLEYTDAESQGSRAGVSTFDSHHANLFLRSYLRPNLLGHIEIEYEHGGDIVEIDQAFLEWAPSDWLSLRAGRFYAPFGIERFVWYSPTNALVSRPTVMRDVVPGNFYATGLQLSGIREVFGQDRFSYEIAVTDGLGEDALRDRRGSRQTRDNNSSRALTGRLGYAFGRHAEIGTSFHEQRYANDSDLDLTFFGLDFTTRLKGWELRTEWVQAVIEEEIFSQPGELAGTNDLGTNDLEQAGWYAQLAYSFLWNRDLAPELRWVTRYGEVDLDRSATGNDNRRLWTLGLNLLILDHLRAKAEYQIVSEDGPSRDDDVFRLQLVLDF